MANRARRFSKMAEGVPGFSPVAEEDVLLAGVRDAQTAEEERLAASRVTVVGADRIGREDCASSRLPWTASGQGGQGLRAPRRPRPAKAGRANELAPEGGVGVE